MMCYLHLARAVLPTNFPIEWNQTPGFVNCWKNADNFVPTNPFLRVVPKILNVVLLYCKIKFRIFGTAREKEFACVPAIPTLVLQCGAVWCSVVQCGAVWCYALQCRWSLQNMSWTSRSAMSYSFHPFTAGRLQHNAKHCSTVQHTAAHSNTLQHTATHSNALQHAATHCNILQHTPAFHSHGESECGMNCRGVAACCCLLHCNTLQDTAAHCNALYSITSAFQWGWHTCTATHSTLKHAAEQCNEL